MRRAVQFTIEIPNDIARFKLPRGVQTRLKELLDRQDDGHSLSAKEKKEADGLVELAELLSLLRLRAERCSGLEA